MSAIPLVDLKAQYRGLKDEITAAMTVVMDNTAFILGPQVAQFEQEFADFVGCGHAVGVASGTDALLLMLKALGIGAGDEVILPANTFVATAYAVSLAGARPVLADVNEADFLIDPDQVAQRMTPRTKAILPVHLYGRVADMSALRNQAGDLPILEDACQAHGARGPEGPAGSLGLMAAFSFYPGKNLGAFGDGGIVTTNDPGLADRLGKLRNYGQTKKYHHDLMGTNSRLDTLQAAVLLVKLKRLAAWNQRRRSLAQLYRQLLADTPVILPADTPGHIYHLFAIRSQQRDALLDHLNAQGIGAGIHYPVPIHLHQAYADLGHGRGDFPVAERMCREELSLPLFPEMTDRQAEQVAATVKDFFKK